MFRPPGNTPAYNRRAFELGTNILFASVGGNKVQVSCGSAGAESQVEKANNPGIDRGCVLDLECGGDLTGSQPDDIDEGDGTSTGRGHDTLLQAVQTAFSETTAIQWAIVIVGSNPHLETESETQIAQPALHLGVCHLVVFVTVCRHRCCCRNG